MAKSYVRSANLRGLMVKSQCPEALQNCQTMFEKLVNSQLRDTLLTDMRILSALDGPGIIDEDGPKDDVEIWNERTARPLPQDLSSMLTQLHLPTRKKAQFLTHLTINGLLYAISSKHKGNSCVLLKTDGGRKFVPAQIKYIFQLLISDDIHTMIAIQRHQASQASCDPFSRFPYLRAQLWSNNMEALEVVKPHEISSHFATLHIHHDEIVVISLSRSIP